jgi:hypothetical protein
MWIDTKPKGGIQILTAFPFNVEGQPIHIPATIAHEQNRVKNVVADGQSYQVTLNCQPEQLVASGNVKMTFEIRDANGKPISNLEPLMAAGGHCVILLALIVMSSFMFILLKKLMMMMMMMMVPTGYWQDKLARRTICFLF